MADRTYDYEEVRRDTRGANWWPLLVLPILFFAGWAAHDAMDNTSGAEAGIGGAPYAPCDVTTE